MAGSLARMLWLVPFTAIYLPAYEQSKRCLLALAPGACEIRCKTGAKQV